MSHTLNWKPLNSKQEFDQLLESSRTKPALVFKHKPSSPESSKIKQLLERDWTIAPEQIDLFLVDVMKDKEVSYEVAETAGVLNAFPQILLFADGITIYDESHDMIDAKKIKLALKIINRTFK